MSGPEIVAVIAGVGSVIVALLTAAGTIWYNWRRSAVEVRAQQFTELKETVETLGERVRCLRQDLREAEQEIDELQAENARLQERIRELEAENARLREKLGCSSA